MRIGSISSLFVALFASAGIAWPASGQALEHEYVTPAGGTATQRFGAALAVDGDVMVVGAPNEDTKALNAGAAFVFRWDAATNTWMEEQELFPSDPEAQAAFGRSVAISGDAIAVGAPLEDNSNGIDAGAAYVFRFDPAAATWTQEQKLIESGGAQYVEFGSAVAVSGTGLVVGSPKCDMPWGAESGCAYVYRWQGPGLGWSVEEMLSDPDGGFGDHAGAAVAIEDHLVLVASPLSHENGLKDAGSVAVWRESGSIWSFDEELTSSRKAKNDHFGSSVALQDGLVMIGAPLENESASIVDSGAAYVFRHDGTSYVEEARLVAPSPASGQQFGGAVAIDEDLAIVGAMWDDAAATDAGAAFTFRRDHRRNASWWFDQPLGASDAAASDRFGASVALNGAQMLVGADGNDTASGADWGVVYGYLAAEINLEITPETPAAGAPVTMTAFHGDPGEPVVIVLTEASGVPFFLPMLTSVFASDHAFTVTGNAPDPLFGVHAGFRACKISATGPIVISDVAYVDV